MRVSGKQWYGAAVIALILPTGWAFYRWVSSLLSLDVPSAFHGAKLGMSVADVRARFDVAANGAFHARPDGEAGWALDWSAHGSTGPVRGATFEFHEGLLVAIRAVATDADAIADRDAMTTTAATVRRVSRRNDRLFDVLILSRGCPAHADEVRRVLRGS